MNTIKVEKRQLLAKLKENRLKHVETYEEAIERYKDAVQSRLITLLRKAEAGVLLTPEELWVKIDRPMNKEQDYDLAISMLEWETSDTVELEAHDFRRYVNDDWEWKDAWRSNTMSYVS